MNPSEVVYAGHSKTEYMAIEYLRKRFRKIVKNPDRTPTFICDDSVRVEVKRLQAGIIYFTRNQVSKMKDDDIVLVFDDNGFVSEFKWKDRNNQPFRIKIIDKSFRNIKIDEDTYYLLLFTKACLSKKLERMYGSSTLSDTIAYLVRKNMDELLKLAKEIGVSVPKEVKLSEL
jgi:hypothetical protein